MNPDESIPTNSCPIFVRIMNDEIIFSSRVPLILSVNFGVGIGPTTTKKLKEAGIVSVMDLAVASAEELAIDIHSPKESAATFVI